jgi:polysaccharide biosynthesis transport protein
MEKENQIQLIGTQTGLRRRATDFLRVEPAENATGLVASWRVMRKRRWSVICVMALVVAAVALWTLQQKPMYEATGMLEIEPESPNILSVQELFQIENTDEDYLETQYKILQSDSLAREVIGELHLGQSEEFNSGEGNGGLAKLFERRTKNNKAFPKDATHEQRVLQKFEGRLTVEPIQRSRLVRVIFDSQDPQLAAKVVNTVARCYGQDELRMHWEAAQKASVWLGGQLDEVKLKLEKSENQLEGYASDNGLLYLQRADGQTENIVDQRLRELQDELSQAQADRYQKEAAFRLAEAGDYGALPGVFDNKVTQDLTDRLADLEQQQAALAPTFKPDYPKMKEIESQIERIEESLQQQRQQAERHVADEYFAAIHREDLVTKAFSAEEKSASEVAQKAVQYNILKREVDTNKQLYDGLLQHLKEAGISSALSASSVRVVDAAVPPVSPAKPRVALNLGFGLLLGLLSGAGLALMQERADNTLKSPEDVEQRLRMPVLGMIPLENVREGRKGLRGRSGGIFGQSGATELIAQSQHDGVWLRMDAGSPALWEFREAFRALRTSVLLKGAGRPPRTLTFTSSEVGEGKTTICCNLAMSLANLGKRVLVIDADIRKSQVQEFFELNGSAGLVNYLAGEGEWRSFVQMSRVKGLDCLICGPELPNPGELLSSERMDALIRDAMNDYSFVLVDSPALLDFSDGRLVATLAEGAILVVRGGATSRQQVQRAQACAANVGARVIGVVLNGAELRNSGYLGMEEKMRRGHRDGRARASA